MRPRVKVRPNSEPSSHLYQCDQCGAHERIPADVIAYFDAIDPGDPDAPPTFQCSHCPGIVYPDWWFRAKRATPQA